VAENVAILTSYIRHSGTYQVTQLADLLVVLGVNVTIVSDVPPQRGVSRYWDEKIVYLQRATLSAIRPTIGFFCPVVGYFLPGGDFSSAHISLFFPSVKKWYLYPSLDCSSADAVNYNSTSGPIYDRLLIDSGRFDECVDNGRCLVFPRVFDGGSLGYEWGARTDALDKAELRMTLAASGKLFQDADSWHSYSAVVRRVCRSIEKIRVHLVLESSVPKSIRSEIRYLSSTLPGRFTWSKLVSFSDYPLIAGDCDVFIDLNYAGMSSSRITAAQCSGAPVIAYKCGSNISRITEGVTGWFLGKSADNIPESSVCSTEPATVSQIVQAMYAACRLSHAKLKAMRFATAAVAVTRRASSLECLRELIF
jgi:hypothetical protein